MKYQTVESGLKKKSKKKIIKDYIELLKEKDKLEKELKKYKNSNTPSSANKHLKPNTNGLKRKKGSKQGAPKGHNGTTRKQDPTISEVVDAKHCPMCNSTHLEDKKVLNRVVEDTPEPIIPETKEVEIHIKKCKDCGLEFVPPNNTTPLKGKFGINLMILIIFIKFILRGVLRKTSLFLDSGFAFRMTPASVNAVIKRVADAAEKEYEELKQKVREATRVYVDETSFSVLGINQWVWVFRTKTEILLVIRPSRGSNVLQEILGEKYSGVVICDCWRAYNFLSKTALIQRCWAHLLRKSKILKTIAGRHLHEKLGSLFKEIKEFNLTNPTEKQRLEKYCKITARLKKIVKYYSKYAEILPVMKYIDNNIGNWFTCIKVEGVEPTNNFAEQAIRETVVVRKIIGAFRSETGKHNYETLASLIASWKLSELDLKKELKRMLLKNLCFC